MKRRELLMAGAAAVGAVALPNAASAQQPAAPELHAVGAFLLQRTGDGLRIQHLRNPTRILWESAPDGNFIIAEAARAAVRDFGTPEGSFSITDSVSATFQGPSIDAIDVSGGSARVTGKLSGEGGIIDYTLAFTFVSPTHLRFQITTSGAQAAGVNRIRLRSASSADEAFFGFGEQLTFFNQKGRRLPLVVQEHGVGRGQLGVTQVVDLLDAGGGGTPYSTEAPAPHFISSRRRSMFLENTEYIVFDMRAATTFEAKVWSGTMTGRILYGETPLDLIEAYTAYAGRMRELPDWIHGGVVAGVGGGTKVVREKLDKLRKADVPLAGLWIQDWVGLRITPVGQQLWWNWKLDETYYPHWQQIVSDLESRGARMLTYINPFLSDTKGHDALFVEGRDKGYLVRNPDGTPFLNRNTTFSAALIDLSNPETRTWIKDVIKTELIGKAGASGWMADFGEALPFDAKLHDGADAAAWHNRFPEEWAKVNREAIEEAGRGEDIVFFDRSGFTRSPAYATLFWLGDQLQDWSEYDGIKSAVVGTLSGGVSGFSLLNGDVGGYVNFSVTVGGHKIPIIARSNELLQRWMEFAAFTSVFRTHEGLDTTIGAQFDSAPENAAHLARFGKVYKGLAPYRKRLVAEAAQRGYPVVRHPFLHYPDDPNTHQLRYQFLLGPDLLVAPVLDKGADSVEVYFPRGSAWTDLWTGADAGRPGDWAAMPAPLSKPAVFVRKGAANADEIRGGLKAVGVL